MHNEAQQEKPDQFVTATIKPHHKKIVIQYVVKF
jgi:hypothetical protein